MKIAKNFQNRPAAKPVMLRVSFSPVPECIAGIEPFQPPRATIPPAVIVVIVDKGAPQVPIANNPPPPPLHPPLGAQEPKPSPNLDLGPDVEPGGPI